jgi:hypothetical protein
METVRQSEKWEFGMACYAVELGRPHFMGQHDGKAGGGVGASALLFHAFWYFTFKLTASLLLVY